MTRIVEITGINRMPSATASMQSELTQRAALVKAPAFVDTSAMSEGEMNVFLLAQRAKMLSEFFPEAKEYRANYEKLRDVLFNGLHRAGGLAVLRQRLQTQPAMKFLPWDAKQRTPAAGFAELFDDAPGRNEIGVIPQLDCEKLYPIFPVPPGQNENNWVQFQNGRLNACKSENNWRKWLNDHWEKQSHTLLYRFMSLQETNQVPTRAAIKADKHYTFFSWIQKASTISDVNLITWLANGVIYNNVKGAPGKDGIGPLTGKQTIEALKEHPGVNGFPIFIIPLALAVIAHTFNSAYQAWKVLDGSQTLKQGLQNHIASATSVWQQYGQDVTNFAASNKDFDSGDTSPGPGGNPPNTDPDTTQQPNTKTLLLLGGAGLALWGLTR